MTKRNTPIIEDMCRWLNRDPSFRGNLNAGFLLYGPVGTGKTMLIQGLSEAMRQSGCRISLVTFSSNQIARSYRDNKQEEIDRYLRYQMISIDDLAMEREPKTNSYGNVVYPVYEVLMERFTHDLTTHATTNLVMVDLLKFYNDDLRRLEDRMGLIFNIRELSGNSWRKSLNS